MSSIPGQTEKKKTAQIQQPQDSAQKKNYFNNFIKNNSNYFNRIGKHRRIYFITIIRDHLTACVLFFPRNVHSDSFFLWPKMLCVCVLVVHASSPPAEQQSRTRISAPNIFNIKIRHVAGSGEKKTHRRNNINIIDCARSF